MKSVNRPTGIGHAPDGEVDRGEGAVEHALIYRNVLVGVLRP